MADSDRDLYSFLRSKDLPDPDGDAETDQEADPDGAAGGGNRPDPEVEVVDSFEDTASSSTDEIAGLAFEDDDLPEKLGDLPRKTLDEAPFGIVQVDDEGIVQFYNQYESEMADVAPEDAIGRNFFTELAPCSGNRLFHGRFKEGIRKNDLDERFSYTFTYKMSPTLVDVRMHRDEEGRNWVLVRKR